MQETSSYRWKTVQVFISSTFTDMHAERDYLVKWVFPRLREWCEQWKLHIVDVDLRWGITAAEAKSEKKIINICLELIDKSQIFICMLGNRYGTEQKVEDISDETMKTYDRLKDIAGYSTTHIEIHHATIESLKSDCKHEPFRESFFFFRDENSLPKKEGYKNVFVEIKDYHNKRLSELKEQIKRKYKSENINNNRVFDYSPKFDETLINPEDKELKGRFTRESLSEFGDKVYEQICKAINNQFHNHINSIKAKSEKELTDNELDYHELFVENRIKLFTGRDEPLNQLTKYVEGDDSQIQYVYGNSGSGKSALLSKFYRNYKYDNVDKEINTDIFFITHFIGASPGSSALYSFLSRMCNILKEKYNISDQIPIDTVKLPETFNKFLKQVKGKTIILIDGLNQLDKSDSAHDLYWLPNQLPHNVKIIVSTLKGSTENDEERIILNSLKSKTSLKSIEIKPLTQDERKEIICKIPTLFCKTLDPEYIEELVKIDETGNPLYLKVALDEMRIFGGYGEKLKNLINSFPSKISKMFVSVLSRLENDLTDKSKVLEDLFCLLKCSRNGLSSNELQSIMRDDKEHLFEGILRQLRDYMQYRGKLIYFFHDQIRLGVEEKYDKTLKTASAQLHSRIAKELSLVRNDSAHAIRELPYHLIEGELLSDLESILSDSQYLTRVAKQKFVSSFNYDIQDGLSKLSNKIKGTLSELIINAWGNEQNNIISNPEITVQTLYNSIQHMGCSDLDIKKTLLDRLMRSSNKGEDDKFTHWLLLSEKADSSSLPDNGLIFSNTNQKIKFLNFCYGGIVILDTNEQLIEIRDGNSRVNVKKIKIQNQFLNINQCLISPDRNHILVYTESGNDSDYLIVSVIDSHGNIVSQCEVLDEYRYSILFMNSNNVLLANYHTLSMWDFTSNSRRILLEIEKGYIISKADINLKENIIALYFEASECQLVNKLNLYNLYNNSLVLIREIQTMDSIYEYHFCGNGSRIAYREGPEIINIYDFTLNKFSFKKAITECCFMLDNSGDKLYFSDYSSLNCVMNDGSIRRVFDGVINQLSIFNTTLYFELNNGEIRFKQEFDDFNPKIAVDVAKKNLHISNSAIIMNPKPHLLISSVAKLFLCDIDEAAKLIYDNRSYINTVSVNNSGDKVFIKDDSGYSNIISLHNYQNKPLNSNQMKKKVIYHNNFIFGITDNEQQIEIYSIPNQTSTKIPLFPNHYDQNDKCDVDNQIKALQYFQDSNMILYATIIKSSEFYLSLHIIDVVNFRQTDFQHCFKISMDTEDVEICYPYMVTSTKNESIIYHINNIRYPEPQIYSKILHNFEPSELFIKSWDHKYYIIFKNNDLMIYSITDNKFAAFLAGVRGFSQQYPLDYFKLLTVSQNNEHNIYQFIKRKEP